MLIIVVYLLVLAVAATLTFAAFGSVGNTVPTARGSSEYFSVRGQARERKKLFAADSPLMRKTGLPAQQQRILSFLEDHCPVIPVCAASARVLGHPTAFYEELKRQIAQAQHSIFFSALYIGDGPLSNSFVGALESKIAAVVAAHEERLASHRIDPAAEVTPFEVGILLDYNRMHDRRNLVTVRRLLTTAHMTEHQYNQRPDSHRASGDAMGGGEQGVNHSPVKVRLYLYQSPCRWNRLFALFGRAKEVLGVQHTKVFVFDGQHTILTGANLSDDYFASRMDRYILYERNEHLAFFFLELLRVLFAVSHPVVSLADFVGQLGGARDDLAMEPRSPLERIGRLMRERRARRVGCAAADGVRPSSPCADPASPTCATDCNGHGAASPSDAQQSLQEQMVFPFGRRRRVDCVDRSHGSPTLHRASDLVILPNELGFDPSLESSAYAAQAKELCLDFAERMSAHFQNLAHDILSANTALIAGGSGDPDGFDSVVFPTIQFGRAGIFHDSFIVKGLLALASSSDHVFVTSPYMNFYSDFLDVLIGKAKADSAAMKAMYPYTPGPGASTEKCADDNAFGFDCITASVKTNGWNGQRGFAGLIPFFYLQLERAFYFLVKTYDCLDRVRIHEFTEKGLTFHAKGMFFVGRDGVCAGAGKTPLSSPGHGTPEPDLAVDALASPYLVAYGSTNYGYRSVHKDVEAEGFFFTFNDSLRAQTRLELAYLLQHSTIVGERQFVGRELGRFQPVISLIAQMGQYFL